MSQASSFVPIQIVYEPSSFILDPYDPLPFPEEVDTISFKRQDSGTTTDQPYWCDGLQEADGPGR